MNALAMTVNQAIADDWCRRYPGFVLVFRCSAALHVVARAGEPIRELTPAEADVDVLRRFRAGDRVAYVEMVKPGITTNAPSTKREI